MMKDSSSLTNMLDRAGYVFELADHFTKSLDEDWQANRAGEEQTELKIPLVADSEADTDRNTPSQQEPWDRHRQNFIDLSDALEAVNIGIDEAPEGFELISRRLFELRDKVSWIRQSTDSENHCTHQIDKYQAALQVYPEINTVVFLGKDAIRDAIAENLKALAPEATASFTCLDRYPATPNGHVGFLEFVRDEAQIAAEAKRQRFSREYSNATLDSMVRGIKRAEAVRRIGKLSSLDEDAVERVDDVLSRELSVGTVEQFDLLLQPAVQKLRDAWEDRAKCVTKGHEVRATDDSTRETSVLSGELEAECRKRWDEIYTYNAPPSGEITQEYCDEFASRLIRFAELAKGTWRDVSEWAGRATDSHEGDLAIDLLVRAFDGDRTGILREMKKAEDRELRRVLHKFAMDQSQLLEIINNYDRNANEPPRNKEDSLSYGKDQTPLGPDEVKAVSDLANHYGVSKDKLRGRLDTWRKNHIVGSDWIEVSNPGPRGSRYLYRVGAVQHVIDKLKKVS